MKNKKNHFRQILLFLFFKGISAAEATKELLEVYGEKALKERQCRNWFARFRVGDYSLKDEPHTGRPFEVGDEEIKAIIDADPHISIRELGERLQVHFSTIDRHLHKLGYIKQHNDTAFRNIKHSLEESDPVDISLNTEEPSSNTTTIKTVVNNREFKTIERVTRSSHGRITKTNTKVRKFRRK